MKEYTLKENLPVTPREFFSLFFEKEDFFVKFHQSIGHKSEQFLLLFQLDDLL